MEVRNHLDFGAAARAINLPDPASAQDAATKAYVDARLGWTDLALVTPGAVNAIDFAAIDPAYTDLRIVLEGVSHGDTSNRQWTLAVSPDGTTYSAAGNLSTNVASSATMVGSLEISGYRGDAGSVVGFTSNIATSPALASGTTQNMVWRCTGGIHSLRIGISGGATFSAGRVRLQARG